MGNTRDFVQISRDSFAREDTVRRLVEALKCSWCGGRRYKHGVAVPKLFEYGTWTDGGTLTWHRGVFCSKGCHGSYHSLI